MIDLSKYEKRCSHGVLVQRIKQGQPHWYMKLDYIYTPKAGKKVYRKNYVWTGLPATEENREKAEKILRKELRKRQQSRSLEDITAETPFYVYCEEWLERKKPTLEQTTYEGYVYKMEHIIRFFKEKDTSIEDLSPKITQQFYNSLLNYRIDRSAQRHEVGLSNRSIKDIAVLYRSVVEDAYLLDYIQETRIVDKIRKIKYPKRPESKAERSYIGEENMHVFLDAIKGHRLETAFKLALFYGLRREEICGLKWSSIRDGRIYIERTVAKVKTTVEKDRTKTEASRRDHVLTPEIVEMLNQVKHEQKKNRLKMGEAYKDSGFVFTWEDGHPYSTDYYTKSFKKIVRKTDGLDNSLRFHDLRASCVSIFVNANVSPKAVQKWTGHEDFETMFKRYARANQAEEDRLASYMQNVMFS